VNSAAQEDNLPRSDSGIKSPLEIAIWNASGLPPQFTTGVGKVFINMALEFEKMHDLRPTLLLPRTDPVNSESDPSRSPLGHLPRRRLPLDRIELEILWRTIGRPLIDRWADGADWIYCPRELWCPPGRLRYAITVHDVFLFEPEVWSGSLRLRLQKKLVWQRALDRADVVFTVSEFTRQRILVLFRCDPEKIQVTPNAVDSIFLGPRSPGKQPLPESISNAPYILQVGGLTRKKGAPSIIALSQELDRRNSPLKVVVIGPIDPEFQSAAAKCAALTVIGRGLAPEAIRWVTEDARVAILPSVYEGFGIPVLEAMAVGVPAIGSCHASLPEIMGPGGLVVDPSATAKFADLVESLHFNLGERAAAIAYGRRRASEFSWQSTAAKIRGAFLDFG